MSRLTLAASLAAVFVPSLLQATEPFCVPRPNCPQASVPCPQTRIPCPQSLQTSVRCQQPCAKRCLLTERLSCLKGLTPRLPLCKPSCFKSVMPTSCCKTSSCCKKECCEKECEVVLKFERAAPQAAPFFVPPPQPQMMMVPQTVMVPTMVQSQAWMGYNAYGYGWGGNNFAANGFNANAAARECMAKAYRDYVRNEERRNNSNSSARKGRSLEQVDAALKSVEEKLEALTKRVDAIENR